MAFLKFLGGGMDIFHNSASTLTYCNFRDVFIYFVRAYVWYFCNKIHHLWCTSLQINRSNTTK